MVGALRGRGATSADSLACLTGAGPEQYAGSNVRISYRQALPPRGSRMMTNSSVSTEWVRPVREHLLSRISDELQNWVARGNQQSNNGRASIADELLKAAVEMGASDIHLTPYSDRVLIRVRIDGALLDVLQLPLQDGMHLIRNFKVMAELDPTRSFKPADARHTRRIDDLEVDLRLACAPCVTGEMLSIRLLTPQRLRRTVEDLGLCEPERLPIEQWLAGSGGMLLATGPTGSGKTTTLCALLHELKMTDRSVVTIEDPVEYQIDGVAQMQVDERHGLTFAEGLRAMLRLDADYLLLGEIRDAESAQVALEASTSGRVLMSTLHSRDAFGAVTALRNWDLADHEIASCLEMVIAQRLVRKLCPHCRQLGPPTDNARQWLTLLGLPVPRRAWNGVGCPECHQLGYIGRTGVFEVWRVSEDAYQLILQHTDERSLRESQVAAGHRPLLVDGLSMAAQGITSLDEVRVLGSCYVPPPHTPAAKLVRESLGSRSAKGKSKDTVSV
jgi:general secretion pathway protein E